MDDFNVKYHKIGRIWMAGAIIMMAFIPIGAMIILDSGPDWKAFGVAFALLTLMNLPTAIGEVLAYSYMLGTNGTYLAFVTGNLSNLKIPCVINAVNIVETKVGTEENEIASTISIAASTLVTVVIIGIGVLLLAVSGAAAVFESSYVQPAFSVVAYALFGALGGQYLVKYPKIAIWPFVIMAVLAIVFVVAGIGETVVKASYFVFLGVVLCFLNARRLYGKKSVKTQTDEVRSALMADGKLLDFEIAKLKKSTLAESTAPNGWVLSEADYKLAEDTVRENVEKEIAAYNAAEAAKAEAEAEAEAEAAQTLSETAVDADVVEAEAVDEDAAEIDGTDADA